MLLRVDGVDCAYDGVKALEDITFETGKGDFIGIIGPNGSGKTTLIRCLSKVLEPIRGTVFLNGKTILEMTRREVAKLIGVVPQSSRIAFAFTAFEIVLMGRTPRLDRFQMEAEEDLQIAKKAMIKTDSWQLRSRLFGDLSGGEQQRVIIARALAQEPEVLLLDEPTSHLDIGFQLEILEFVKVLCEEKNIVVLSVFHDLNLAARFCNKLILLNGGKIHSLGPTEDVLSTKNILDAYRVLASIERNQKTGFLVVVPISSIRKELI